MILGIIILHHSSFMIQYSHVENENYQRNGGWNFDDLVLFFEENQKNFHFPTNKERRTKRATTVQQ
jgi:hypothetical protein